MSNTTRQTITLTCPQLEFLKAEAARLGIGLGELIRRIIDEWRQKEKKI